MRLAKLRRLALGVGLVLCTVHCSSSDDDVTPDTDASSDAAKGDGSALDGRSDARDSTAGSGGAAGSDAAVDRAGSGGVAVDSSVDGSAGIDASAGSAGAAVDSGADAHADVANAVDASDAHTDAEASTPVVEAGVDAGADTGADAKVDAPVVDTGIEAGAVDAGVEATIPLPDGGATFTQVRAILTQHCASCHSPSDAGTTRIDLITPTGLYDRLTALLPANEEGFCNVDGGADGGGAGWHAIVPGDTSSSYLYLKVSQVAPAICGARMPRVTTVGTSSVGCDVAEADGGDFCLSQTDLDTIETWIEADAPNN